MKKARWHEALLRDLAALAEAHGRYAALLERCRGQSAALIKAACYELDLSQRELAKRLGVHHSYLSMLVSGKREPGFGLLKSLHGLLQKRDR